MTMKSPTPSDLEDGKLITHHVEQAESFKYLCRICPGRHLSSASVCLARLMPVRSFRYNWLLHQVWLSAAAVLSAFNIERNKDEFGHYVPLDVKYVEKGITRFVNWAPHCRRQYLTLLCSHPHSFQCSILPRSEKAVQLILERHHAEYWSIRCSFLYRGHMQRRKQIHKWSSGWVQPKCGSAPLSSIVILLMILIYPGSHT